MIKLIQFLFSGCWHHYDIIQEGPVVDKYGVKTGTLYTLQCKKCGDITSKTVRPSAVWEF